MHFETEYTLTPELQHATIKQMFFVVLLKKRWWGIAGLWLLAGASFLVVGVITWAMPALLCAIAFMQTALWLKAYFHAQKQARGMLAGLEDPRVILKFDDAAVVFSGSNGSKRFKWKEFDLGLESEDFIFLLVGKAPVLSLPKAHLDEPVRQWLRQRFTL